MRMKFLRIFPETCASTWCLFSNSTLNMALGNGSRTVAITSIASSLLMHLSKNYDASLRQNHWAVLCDSYTVLEVSAVASIHGHRGPLIVENPRFWAAGIYHRLNRQNHSFFQRRSETLGPEIWNLRLFVKARPDSVPYKLANHAEAVRLNVLLNCCAYVANRVANLCLLDAFVQRGFGYFEQLPCLRR